MELRNYQLAGVDFLRKVRRGVLADEMGVGKTPQLIAAATGRTLIVAPPTLHRQWKEELFAWRPGLDATVTSYHSLVDSSRKDGHGHVAGVVLPKWRQDWDTLIFDECHHLKGRNTGYARAGVRLAGESDRVWLASGTPIRNWGHEIFMLLRALYPGDPRFSSYWRWADKWFEVEDREVWRGRKRKTYRHVGKLRDITDWYRFAVDNGLNNRWLRRTLEHPSVDIELPPLNLIDVKVQMGSRQKALYQSMEQDFFAQHEGQTTIATSHGSQFASLLRFTSGVGFHPDFESGPSAKLDALADIVHGNDGPLLVFCWYQDSAELLRQWFSESGWAACAVHGGYSRHNQESAIKAFQSGGIDVLVGTLATMAEGHNLTRASKTILFEHSPVPAHTDQAIKRTHRFGQEQTCTVWSLVLDDTVDDYYYSKLLPAKRGQAEGMTAALDDIRDWLQR